MNPVPSFCPKLIIGLGNPGPKYAHTYHNLGTLMADFLIKEWPSEQLGEISSKKLKIIRFEQVSIGQSLAFMNQSGEVVKDAAKKLHLPPKNILILHDDSDLEIGRYKLAFGQGPAGHKGISSVIECLKTKDFWRLRLGIRPNHKTSQTRPKAGTFVLKNINPKNRFILKELIKEIIPVLIKATS